MMSDRIWQIYYCVVFRLACTVSGFIRLPLYGSLVAIWHRGRILVVQKSYQKGWSIPGGLLKKGETWKQAAVRETREEVGVQIDEAGLVFKTEMTGDLGPRNRTYLFEVEIDDDVDIQVDGREIVFAEFVSPEDALTRRLNEILEDYLMNRAQ